MHLEYIDKVELNASITINVTDLAQYIPAGYHVLSEQTGSEYIVSGLSSGKIILGFTGLQSSNTFVSITSFYSGNTLACYLSNIPSSKAITGALKGTKLEIPSLSTAQIQYCSYTIEERNKVLEQMQTINEVGQERKKANFLPEDAIGINQHHFGFTDYKSDKPILGTFGMGPCIGVALYNPAIKSAALAHLDGIGGIETHEAIVKMITQISNGDDQLECHLRGGNEMSYPLFYDILLALNKYSTINITSAEVIKNSEAYHSRELAIDSRTGEVYTDFSSIQVLSLASTEKELKEEVEITVEFDGRAENFTNNSSQIMGNDNDCQSYY